MRPRKGPLLFEEATAAAREPRERRRQGKAARPGAGPQKLGEHREEVALVAAEDLLGAREGRLVVPVLQSEAKRPLDLSCEEGAESLHVRRHGPHSLLDVVAPAVVDEVSRRDHGGARRQKPSQSSGERSCPFEGPRERIASHPNVDRKDGKRLHPVPLGVEPDEREEEVERELVLEDPAAVEAKDPRRLAGKPRDRRARVCPSSASSRKSGSPERCSTPRARTRSGRER